MKTKGLSADTKCAEQGGRPATSSRTTDNPGVAYERLLLATEGAGVGTYDIDIETGCGYWSPWVFALFGLVPVPDGFARFAEWRERIHPEDYLRLVSEHTAAAARGGAWQAEFRVVRADNGEVAWLQTLGQFTHSPGARIRSTGVVIDISRQKQVEAELRESESRLRRSQEAGGVGSYEWLMDGSGGTQSEGMLRLIGLEPGPALSFAEICQNVHAEDIPLVEATVQAIQAGCRKRETHYRVVRKDGQTRWIRDIGQLELDKAGKPYRWVGIVQDITEQKRHEERRDLLINELNHRVKNTLAVVQAMAHQTLKSDVPIEAARAALDQRLVALAAAHDLLTRESWASVRIEDLVVEALRALGVARGKVRVSGPDLQMKPKPAVSLSMALHELGTNALKYGSLLAESGQVDIVWTTDAENLHFTWIERGGPAPAANHKPGFGTRMIQLALSAELNGTTELRFLPVGLECVVVAPVQQALESGRLSGAGA